MLPRRGPGLEPAALCGLRAFGIGLRYIVRLELSQVAGYERLGTDLSYPPNRFDTAVACDAAPTEGRLDGSTDVDPGGLRCQQRDRAQPARRLQSNRDGRIPGIRGSSRPSVTLSASNLDCRPKAALRRRPELRGHRQGAVARPVVEPRQQSGLAGIGLRRRARLRDSCRIPVVDWQSTAAQRCISVNWSFPAVAQCRGAT